MGVFLDSVPWSGIVRIRDMMYSVVDPVRLEGGSLTAHDHRADDVRAFAVHRITSVSPLPARA